MNAVAETSNARASSGGTTPIYQIRRNTAVAPLLAQLELHPDLWDQNRFRTVGAYGNPHGQLSDIIVRYRHWGEWTGDRRAFVDPPHEAVWWRAVDDLPYIRPLVFDLARLVEAEQIGMVLITRLRPHEEIGWHVDLGWHARFYTKFLVQLTAHEHQRFCYEDFELVTEPGGVYIFRNDIKHRVVNDSEEDRLSLIICLRTRQPTCVNCSWGGN